MPTAIIPLLDRLYGKGYCLAGDVDGRDNPIGLLCHALTLLFNSTGLSNRGELRSRPHVTRSVLNYGLGNFAGVLFSSMDFQQLEGRIRTLIRDFEPRIVGDTLTVEWLPDVGGYGKFCFLISGDLRATASRASFHLWSSWDAESGEVSVSQRGKCNV